MFLFAWKETNIRKVVHSDSIFMWQKCYLIPGLISTIQVWHQSQVFEIHNWTSCRTTENRVPLWHLMQQTIWTLGLLHNRPSAKERKFNNNTKNRSHSQQTTICPPVPWQQQSQRLLEHPQKSSPRKQFHSQVTQATAAFIRMRWRGGICISSKEMNLGNRSGKIRSFKFLAWNS